MAQKIAIKEKKRKDIFWMPFIIIGLLLILYKLLTFSEGYLTFLIDDILGSLIGLSIAFMTFSHKKALITSIVLISLAVIHSIFVSFFLEMFFLNMQAIFIEAFKYLIIFSVIFWVYKKIKKK